MDLDNIIRLSEKADSCLTTAQNLEEIKELAKNASERLNPSEPQRTSSDFRKFRFVKDKYNAAREGFLQSIKKILDDYDINPLLFTSQLIYNASVDAHTEGYMQLDKCADSGGITRKLSKLFHPILAQFKGQSYFAEFCNEYGKEIIEALFGSTTQIQLKTPSEKGLSSEVRLFTDNAVNLSQCSEYDLVEDEINNKIIHIPSERPTHGSFGYRVKEIQETEFGYDVVADEIYFTNFEQQRTLKLNNEDLELFLPKYQIVSGVFTSNEPIQDIPYTESKDHSKPAELFTDLNAFLQKSVENQRSEEKSLTDYIQQFPTLNAECEAIIRKQTDPKLSEYASQIQALNPEFKITHRLKTKESLFKKVIRRNDNPDEIDSTEVITNWHSNDINGIRVVTKNANDCYKALYNIMLNFAPNYLETPKGFIPLKGIILDNKFTKLDQISLSDQIADPKLTGYQCLKLWLGDSLEIQIMSEKMLENSKKGLAGQYHGD